MRLLHALGHKLRARLATGLVLVLASLLFLPVPNTWLEQRLTAILLKADARLRPAAPAAITLVAIDESSIDILGPWPWPRETWAELLQRLNAAHRPALTVLDAVFPPAPEQAQGNTVFARALAATPSVVGQLLLAEPGQRGLPVWARILPSHARDVPRAQARREPLYAGILGTEAVLTDSAQVGHINAAIDVDGVMRRVPTLLCLQYVSEGCAASLLQAMISQLLGTSGWHIRRGEWHESEWMLEPDGHEHLALPVDSDFLLTIPWSHPSGLHVVSATEVWHNTLPAGRLDHHVMIFGGVSLGLGDVATSPLYQTVPGMEVHAQTLAAWLRRELPFEPRYAGPALALWTLLIALLLAAASRRIALLACVTIVGALAPLAGAGVAWASWHAIWPAATPAVFAMLAGTVMMVHQLLKHRSRLVRRLEAYLPSPLRRLLGQSSASVPTEIGWGTVMVADIVGYTVQSQLLTLPQLAQWCDAGINHVVHRAQATGAMLDNVAGDGVLLLWRTGTPASQARTALATARLIIAGFEPLNQKLAAAGLPPLVMGIGIHAGPYLLGSFGTAQKRYTVISDVANLAAHIERETRRHPWPLLFSEIVAKALPGQATRPAAQIGLVHGRHMALYTLVDAVGNHWPDGIDDRLKPAANVNDPVKASEVEHLLSDA